MALAREVERRAPTIATSKWWKEERHGVFIDYNQNAKDRTVAAAYSVRPKPDARVSAPLTWEEIDPAIRRTSRSRRCPGGLPKSATAIKTSIDTRIRWSCCWRSPRASEKEGLGDAPWPPQYKKQAGEPPRVQPSRRRMPASTEPGKSAAAAAKATTASTGRRASKFPLIEIARARRKEDALEGFERWKARHENAAAHLEPADVLVDSMRGRSSTWTRVRVNLQHVPVKLRPKQGPLDPDFDPGTDWAVSDETPRRTPSRARKPS